MIRVAFCICLSIWANPSAALELRQSGAVPTLSEETVAGSVRLPVAPWSDAVRAPQVEGDIRRTVLRSPGGTRTTLQLLAPLRDQLSTAGFQTVFACADRACGGFDFRFEMDLLGAPEMFVDLGDFRYLLMRSSGGAPHTVSIVTSRSDGAGFVHITEVSEASPASSPSTVVAPTPDAVGKTSETIVSLIRDGHAVLQGLEFASGSATLAEGPIADLSALADWLRQSETSRSALVGHTDSVGDRDANRALSQRRAAAARERLLELSGVDSIRIEADGVGYLSPIASNSDEEGRASNRRVEVVLLSIE